MFSLLLVLTITAMISLVFMCICTSQNKDGWLGCFGGLFVFCIIVSLVFGIPDNNYFEGDIIILTGDKSISYVGIHGNLDYQYGLQFSDTLGNDYHFNWKEIREFTIRKTN